MPVVVSTPLGDVEGLRASDGTEAFKGMPFAEPPLGALRFAPAEPKAAWTGTLDAHEYGHQCLQGGLFGSGSTWGEGNEDCLLVNVWRPRGTTPQSNLPVMFFIHGGAFVLGSGGSIEEGTNEHTGMYDGAKLASNGLIIMTIAVVIMIVIVIVIISTAVARRLAFPAANHFSSAPSPPSQVARTPAPCPPRTMRNADFARVGRVS